MDPESAKNNPEQLSVWDFISIVSHQLRNPLASTKLSLEMLLEKDLGPLTPNQEDYIKMIYEDNQRMIRLVKEFLTISAIERGDINLTAETFGFIKLVTEVVRELRPFASAHNTALVYLPKEVPRQITYDKLKIRQVVSNMIDNAIKYTRPGGAIEIRVNAKNKKEIMFEVKDQGIGVPKNEQDKIFTKFFRSSNASAVHPEGTGVGLYMAKAIIEKSGGKIGFESEENKGSRFWFTLPIKRH